MEIGVLAATVFNLIRPIFSNKTVQNIGSELKEATKGSLLELWEKVKPLFIKTIEGKEVKAKSLIQLEENPDDETAKSFVEKKLETEFYENEDFYKDVLKVIEKLEQLEDEKIDNIIVRNSKNVFINKGKDVNVGRDLNIGDSSNT